MIARGIAEGIAQYKKDQKARQRELNKRQKALAVESAVPNSSPSSARTPWLPWALLVLSWAGFAVYLVVNL